jgi:hypothetical protein
MAPPPEAVGQGSAHGRPYERPEQDRAHDDLFGERRKRERLLDEEDGAGDDADVVAEEHPPSAATAVAK